VVFNDLASVASADSCSAAGYWASPANCRWKAKGEHAVVHLVAKRLFDHSELLGTLLTASRDFH
jgi:hypothetical protein